MQLSVPRVFLQKPHTASLASSLQAPQSSWECLSTFLFVVCDEVAFQSSSLDQQKPGTLCICFQGELRLQELLSTRSGITVLVETWSQ